MPSTAERLTQVQTAIALAEKGQSYSVNGQSVTRPNLRDLYEQERRLLALLAAEDAAAASEMPGAARIRFQDPT